MARNRVQFQKGLSETEFNKAYGSEEQCHAALVKWRWPNGFECPDRRGRGRPLRRDARRAEAVPVQGLPQADLGAGRDQLRRLEIAAASMGFRYVSAHANQAGHLHP